MRRWTYLLAAAALVTTLPAAAAAQGTFDHGGFDRLLHAHVRDGIVDYAAFASAPEFKRYLVSLAGFDPRGLPRDERLAFWLNAYNAYTIRLITKHGERNSIRNINKTAGIIKGYGPWNEKLATVGDSAYGLDQIEQKIIRPEFKEPRIHFALVCAALGCPPLRSEAYTGARLEAQLDDQARHFLLRTPAKNRVDVAKRRVYLSELFKFRDYKKDFGGSEAAIARFIAPLYPAGAERDLLEGGRFDVKYTKYDWSLNSREKAGQAQSPS